MSDVSTNGEILFKPSAIEMTGIKEPLLTVSTDAVTAGDSVGKGSV